MIQVLQGNMRHAREAGALLDQNAREEDSNILLLSEQSYNMNHKYWLSDDTGCCAIWLRGRAQRSLTQKGKGNCHVWAKCGEITYISCYLSPNDSSQELATKLANIESTVRTATGGVILGGDFNARALEWGMPTTNPRGRMVLEMATRCKLVVQNRGNKPTYERAGWGASIPDITFSTEAASGKIGDWRVMDDQYNGSDHHYIAFRVLEGTSQRPPYRRRPLGWNVSKMDEDRFEEYLRIESASIPAWHGGATSPHEAEILVKKVTSLLRGACDASMPQALEREKASVLVESRNS